MEISETVIQNEFSNSWDKLIDYFINGNLSFYEKNVNILNSTIRLINELRKRGYDTKLRAGVTVHAFILSRARENDLRFDQECIYIEPLNTGRLQFSYIEKGENYAELNEDKIIKKNDILLCEELENSIERLLDQPIN